MALIFGCAFAYASDESAPVPLSAVVLQGPLVRLEPLEPRHAADLRRVTGEPELWRLMSFGSLEDPQVLGAYIQARVEELSRGEGLTFAIIDPASGRAIGSTSLFDYSAQDERAEIGRTWLGRPYWRTGINTGCKALLLAHAFEALGCRRVQLQTDLLNLRSQSAIERLGAVKEGVLRRNKTCAGGRVRDSVIYSILLSEWPGIRLRLQQLMNR